MSKVAFRIERDDGRWFVIDDSVWRIPNDGLSNWHTTPSDVAMLQNVQRDGAMITSQRVGAIDRSITCELRDARENESQRRLAESFFLPHRNYTVHVEYMGKRTKCEGVQADFTMSEGNVHRPIAFSWSVICSSPYMKLEDDATSSDTLPSVGLFGFPYMVSGQRTSEVADGFAVGISPKVERDEKGSVYIRNDGDMPAFPKVEIGLVGPTKTAKYVIISITVDVGNVDRVTNSYEFHTRQFLSFKVDTSGWFVGEQHYIVIDLAKRPLVLMDDLVAMGNWTVDEEWETNGTPKLSAEGVPTGILRIVPFAMYDYDYEYPNPRANVVSANVTLNGTVTGI